MRFNKIVPLRCPGARFALHYMFTMPTNALCMLLDVFIFSFFFLIHLASAQPPRARHTCKNIQIIYLGRQTILLHRNTKQIGNRTKVHLTLQKTMYTMNLRGDSLLFSCVSTKGNCYSTNWVTFCAKLSTFCNV